MNIPARKQSLDGAAAEFLDSRSGHPSLDSRRLLRTVLWIKIPARLGRNFLQCPIIVSFHGFHNESRRVFHGLASAARHNALKLELRWAHDEAFGIGRNVLINNTNVLFAYRSMGALAARLSQPQAQISR